MQAGAEKIETECVIGMVSVHRCHSADYQRGESFGFDLVSQGSITAGELLRKTIGKERDVAKSLKILGGGGDR